MYMSIENAPGECLVHVKSKCASRTLRPITHKQRKPEHNADTAFTRPPCMSHIQVTSRMLKAPIGNFQP